MSAVKRKKQVANESKLAPPDWKNCSVMFGHNCWDIPEPRVLRFPNNKGVRRTVSVSVTTWRGVALGASHFNASVEPEANSVWDGLEIAWVRDNTFPATKREAFRADVFTRAQAIGFVEIVLRTFFSDETQYSIQCSNDGTEGLEEVLKSISNDQCDV